MCHVVVYPAQIGQRSLYMRAGAVLHQICHARAGVLPKSHGAKKPICGQGLFPEDLREPAICQPADHLHLEEPVLRMYITQGHEQVTLIGCINMRNGMIVEKYFHRLRQSGQPEFGIVIGAGGAHPEITDQAGDQHEQRESDDQVPQQTHGANLKNEGMVCACFPLMIAQRIISHRWVGRHFSQDRDGTEKYTRFLHNAIG